MADTTIKQIDLLQSREPHRVTDSARLVFRQNAWGRANDETLISIHVVEVDGSDYAVASGAATAATLISLAHAALVLAGLNDIAAQLVIPNRPSATKRRSAVDKEENANAEEAEAQV